MATARKEPAKGRTPAAAASRKRTTGTRRKAEGIAVPEESGYVVNRTGVLGGEKHPSAVDTGAGKVKAATGASEAVGGERATTAGRPHRAEPAIVPGRGAAVGTKTGMKHRAGRKLDTEEPLGTLDSRAGRSIPVSEPAKTRSRAGAAATAEKSPEKTQTERARMASRASTGPKGGGKLATAKAAGAKAAGAKKRTTTR